MVTTGVVDLGWLGFPKRVIGRGFSFVIARHSLFIIARHDSAEAISLSNFPFPDGRGLT